MKELESFFMTTSGYISSSRAGKMPESRRPNLPLPSFPVIPTSISSSSRTTAATNEAAAAAQAAELAAQKKKASLERLMRHKQNMALKKAAQAQENAGKSGSSIVKPNNANKKSLSHSAVLNAARDAMSYTTKHGKSKDKVKPKIPATPPGTSSGLNSSFLRNQTPSHLLPSNSSKVTSTPSIPKLPPPFHPPKLKIPTPKLGSTEFSTDVLPLPKEHIKEQEERKLQLIEKEKKQKELVAAAASGLLPPNIAAMKSKKDKEKKDRKLKDTKKEKSDKNKKDGNKEKSLKKEEKEKKKRKEEKKKEKDSKKQKLNVKSPKSDSKKEKKPKKDSDGKKKILSPKQSVSASTPVNIADIDRSKLCIFKKINKSSPTKVDKSSSQNSLQNSSNNGSNANKRTNPFDSELESTFKKARLSTSLLDSTEDLPLSLLSDNRPPTPGSGSVYPVVPDLTQYPLSAMPFIPPFSSDYSSNINQSISPSTHQRPPTPGRSDPAFSSPANLKSPSSYLDTLSLPSAKDSENGSPGDLLLSEVEKKVVCP